MKDNKSLEIKISGMDCADCALHVKKALDDIPSVTSADVLLGAEKAIVYYKDIKPLLEDIQQAVEKVGYKAYLESEGKPEPYPSDAILQFGKTSIFLFIGILIAVLGITLIGERMGSIALIESFIPWYVWLGAIILGGFPVFSQVIRALSRKQIISHTLMSASVLTAIIVGEWATAMLIVLFMRLGDFIEKNTTQKARQAIRKLKQAAPQSAHVIINGKQSEVPIAKLNAGDIVIVKPGESVPVDGVIVDGKAVVNQAAISGESMPIDKEAGNNVYAASIVHNGSLRIQTVAAGKDSLFGRILTMVEEAEANRGEIQNIADRFSSIYLPIVAIIALATYLVSGNIIAAAAVMAVSCSCSFSLATPVAMLASIGTAAQQGLLFKGGKYIESMEHIDSIFIDKTGTLTLGQPAITEIKTTNNHNEYEILQFAASVEQYSEHPLADAVIRKAHVSNIPLLPINEFTSEIGHGVSASVNGTYVQISNHPYHIERKSREIAERMEKQSKTLLYVHFDKQLAAIMGAEDILRKDAKQAIERIGHINKENIIMISGDHTAAVKRIADELGIAFKAEMLPQDKIALIQEAQHKGRRVMMIGDGINDAPALAQADIGVAMGSSGTDIAIETAHIVLLREDWDLIPEAFQIAKRTMRVVRFNIFLTAIYNLTGISLAALGLLAPAVAAAMQSIPDVGIMANSARLLKKKSIA
jgi:Cd2+/Zn2+-exporting ATPase/Cu+-exporting ATPase